VSLILVAVAAIGLAAFTTEAAIGFAGTVLAVTLGANLVGLDQLLAAFVPLNLVLSSTLVMRGLRHVAWRALAIEVAPTVGVGTAIGLALFHLPARGGLELAFGLLVAVLALSELVRAPNAADDIRPIGALAGTGLLGLGGIAHGLFGSGGPMIVYVLRRRLGGDKTAFRATLAVLWLVLNLALVANLASLGLIGRHSLPMTGALAAAIVPGMVLGDRLHHALSPARFWRIVCVVLLLAGVSLAIRAGLALA
jgi:uncharacterized membrane protein YfcA